MSITSLSNQTITVENPDGSLNAHGQKGFGAAVTVKCRFERIYKTIVTDQREREPVHATAGIPPQYTVQRGARVTYGTDKYRVITVAEAPGRSGSVHHRILMLQEWSYLA